LRSRSLAAALAALSFAAHAEVTASNAWIRAMVPGQKTTAAYLTLKSTQDAKLVGVSTTVAGMAMLHSSTIASGVARMDALEVLRLPAGKTVELKPAGDHVMLMDVPRPLKAGETVPLELTIENARGERGTIEVRAIVRPIGE
jgi:copper(I)-binding protein